MASSTTPTSNELQLKRNSTMESLHCALNKEDGEDTAVSCLDSYSVQDEFFENFPCPTLADYTKQQSVFIALTERGWFRLMEAIFNKWKYSQIKIRDILKLAFAVTFRHVMASDSAKNFVPPPTLTSVQLCFEIVNMIFSTFTEMREKKEDTKRLNNYIRHIALDVVWGAEHKGSLIRIICRQDPINKSMELMDDFITARSMFINEFSLEYIPNKLTDNEFQSFLKVMMEWTDKWGFPCCVLLNFSESKAIQYPNDRENIGSLFEKIVDRILATPSLGYNKLEEFLFTPTHMTRCVLFDLWLKSRTKAVEVFGKFQRAPIQSQRMNRLKPLWRSLEFIDKPSGTFRDEVKKTDTTLLFELLKRCINLPANDGAADADSPLPVEVFVKAGDFSYLLANLERIVRLVMNCIDENDKKSDIARPIFQLLDSSKPDSRYPNGLAVLVVFAFVNMIRHVMLAKPDNEPAALSKLSEDLSNFSTLFYIFYRATYPNYVVHDFEGDINKAIREYYRNERAAEATLDELALKTKEILTPIPGSKEIHGLATFKGSPRTFFTHFSEFLLIAAITNDWLKYC